MIIEKLEEDIGLDEVMIKEGLFVEEGYRLIYDGLGRGVGMGKDRGKN